MKLPDVFLISETKEGPILGKCVLGISLISMGSVLTVSPVSSLVILLNLHSFLIILLIPFQVFFYVSSITFAESIVIVYFNFLNFIINLILHVFVRSPIEIWWEPSVYFFGVCLFET